MAKITKALVEHAKAPASGQIFIRDDEITGFALRITANGAKSFTWEGRINGKMTRDTLGKFPDLSVADARTMALDYKAKIARGENPVQERDNKSAALREEKTLAQLIEDYFELHAKSHKKESSRREDEGLIARYLPASWWTRRLSEFTRAEIVRLHQTVGKDHGRYAANHFVRLLRAMFNKAHLWGMLAGANPAVGVDLFREKKRDRFLNPEELMKINAALEQEVDPYWRAYFPLALMLGARRSELLAMRWTDIDFSARTWKIPVTKDGESHLLPLPELAIAILKSLPRGKSQWVFPGAGKSGHLVEPKTAWKRILHRADVSNVRIHDLRHTLASWLLAEGRELPLIGKALNHSQVSTTERYAHLALDPVRAALEQNATQMFGSSVTPNEPDQG